MNLRGFGTDVIDVVEARISFLRLSRAPEKNPPKRLVLNKAKISLTKRN